MNDLIRNSIPAGRIIFGLAMAAFGILIFVYSEPVTGLEPLPSWIPARLFIVYLTGIILVMAGASLMVNRFSRPAAMIIGALFFLWILLLHLPALIAEPRNGGAWTTAAETLALGSAAWVLAQVSTSGNDYAQTHNIFLERMSLLGRLFYGLSLPIFGILHFIYVGYVASVIPSWLPFHDFWAYFTGVALIAGGLGILSGVKARLAAMLVGLMFGLWVLVLHLPRVLISITNKNEWTSMFIAAAMCGGALIIAGSLVKEDLTDLPSDS